MVKNKHIHFIGIGGAGMSVLASLAVKKGYKVTGSDIKVSKVTDNLKKQGVGYIYKNHDSGNINKDINLVVFSSCIKQDNQEIVRAKELQIPLLHRSEFLAELMKDKISITVCGSHGKTTTSAIIYHILYKAGLSISSAIGGESYNDYKDIEKDTKYFVAEADESDGSFTNLSSNLIVLTNLDKDHFNFYIDFDNMVKYFNRYLKTLKQKQNIFANINTYPYKEQLFKRVKAKVNTFGFEKDADLYAYDIKLNEENIECRLDFRDYFKNEKIKVNMPGLHNLENAIASLGVSISLGVSLDEIKESLLSFKGVRRRFQVRLRTPEVSLLEDYAHHPTELKAAIDTVKNCHKPKRVVGVFQPHRFTRTQLLADELAESLSGLDCLILTDIYAANEDPIKDVSVKNIYKNVKNQGYNNVICLPFEEITNYIIDNFQQGDFIMILGAGNINKIAQDLEQKFKNKLQKY